MIDVESRLASVQATLADADVVLRTDLGGYEQPTTVRTWRGQVLVDWEPDEEVGDCLVRPALLARLLALHAQVELDDDRLHISAPGRVVASVSAPHAALVKQLGGARRVELRLELRFEGSTYRRGREMYLLVGRGERRPLLQLSADVTARAASPRTSPAPR